VAEARAGELPHTRLSKRIDALLRRLEDAASWVWLLLLGVIVVNVVARYAFAVGRIEFEELQWHLYSIGFLVGIAAAVASDSHVRVDVLRERFSRRTRAWIELYGLLLLFLPFVALVLGYSVPFVALAYHSGEVSVAAGGLPHRFLIKGALGAGFALLGLAGVARLLRVWAFLFGVPAPVRNGAG
jgi:TRAP-type mannitol/chloroaromatic compound transport system permease small subunit